MREFIFCVKAALIAVVVLWSGWNSRSGLGVRWGRAYGVTVPEDAVSKVDRHLRRGVWGRTLGVCIATLWRVDPVTIAAGYAIGVMLTEVGRPEFGVGVASIARRRLSSYAPQWSVVALRLAQGLLLVTTLWLAWFTSGSFESGRISIGGFIVARMLLRHVVLAAGAVAEGEVLAKWIVSRRQQVSSPLLLAVDDALRASAVRRLVGAALFVGGTSIALALSVATDYAVDSAMWNWALTLMMIAVALGSVAAVFLLPARGRRVARTTELATT